MNKFMLLAISSEGKWQVDDSNQTDYPIVMGNLVANQQDYSFDLDADGNQIMEIYRIEVKDSNGIYRQLTPIDQSELRGIALTEFMKTAGLPMFYDKTANGVFLYPTPNYASTQGLKLYVNRTSTYFTVSDTTKKPGIPWIFHEYLAVRPSYYYSLQKGLPQVTNLGNEMVRFEQMITDYYSKRTRDEPKFITPIRRSSR